MRVGVEHLICWSGHSQNRGSIAWPLGHMPPALPLGLPSDLSGAGETARRFGYQPYAVVREGGRWSGLLAELPLVKRGPRLVVLLDRHGATGMTALPQFPASGEWRSEPVVEDQPQEREEYVLTQFPELADSAAFEWSTEFLAARTSPRASPRSSKRRTKRAVHPVWWEAPQERPASQAYTPSRPRKPRA